MEKHDENTPLKSFEAGPTPSVIANQKPKKKKSTFREYAEALFTALLIAFVLRTFVVEAFKIPSKSMVPTLMVGDHIFVNKFIYGLRVPFTKKWIAHFKTPQRGEVVVFIYPRNESLDFIKRVVGLPGDKVEVIGTDLLINGEKVNKYPVKIKGVNPDNARELQVESIEGKDFASKFKEVPFSPEWKDYQLYIEELSNHPHIAQYYQETSTHHLTFEVPQGHLFVMGDNRDNSSDSREWGFVPLENVKGQAMFIWLSLDHDQG
ncbi:MAG: signal peptidase I, partial [Deltaproteobacteria bacterium]|nr:signal peptidase I [Deltaproteobacteria bacterium]